MELRIPNTRNPEEVRQAIQRLIKKSADETDPIFCAWQVANDHHSQWDEAYGWGDHSSAGYLTAETDPVFLASVASGITQDDIDFWNEGGLSEETDPVFVEWQTTYDHHENWDLAYDSSLNFDASLACLLSGGLGAGAGAEVDPVFTSWQSVYDHHANWDTAYTAAAAANAINGIVKCNGAGSYSAVTDNSANWNTAYGWGNWAHTTLAGYGITDACPLALKTSLDALNGFIKCNGAGTYSAVASNPFTDATTVTAHTSDGVQTVVATIPIPSGKIVLIKALCIGNVDTDHSKGTGSEVSATVHNAAGTATFLGGVPTTIFFQRSGSPYGMSITVSGTNARIAVTGNAATEVSWLVTYTTMTY